MGIGTSDGKYYPTEMEEVLDNFDSRFRDDTHQLHVWNGPMQTRSPDGIILDPIGDTERYDDTMTNEQKYRNEEQWKQGYEGAVGPIINPISPHFNDTLNEIDKEPASRAPITPISDNGGWGPRPKDLPDNIEWAPNMDRVREWHGDPDAEKIEYNDRSELKKLVPEGYEGYATEMSDGYKFLLRRPVKKEKPPLTS